MTSTVQANSVFMIEPEEASSRANYVNILSLFEALRTEKHITSMIFKDSKLKIPNSNFRYKVKLCEQVDLLEDQKRFIRANKIYNESYENYIKALENQKRQLNIEINDNCSELYNERG